MPQASTTISQPTEQFTQSEESNYWAGNEDLTQFLSENGVNSVEELLQYTAGQEQSAEQLQEVFEYAMHPDPDVRSQFWQNYQEALAEQGLIEQPQQQQQQQQQFNRPSIPGTPDSYYGYQQQSQPGFQDIGQFAQQFAMMNSGLPGVTPQSLAEFDRAILMTPGAFWGQNIFEFGDI